MPLEQLPNYSMHSFGRYAEYAKDWAYSIISTHISDPCVFSFFGQVHEPHKMVNFFETEKLYIFYPEIRQQGQYVVVCTVDGGLFEQKFSTIQILLP